MPRRLSINIPDQQIPFVLRFLAMSVDDLNRIAEWISKSSPASDIEDMAQDCASSTGLPEEGIEDAITIAINLNLLQRNIDEPSEEVTRLIAQALSRRLTKVWDDDKQKSWDERAHFFHRVLISDGPIEAMAKARELLQDCQTTFLRSTILTDVRYIYNKDASALLGGLVVNTLSLDFLEASDHAEQLHIVLTTKDIEKLIGQLERAKRKAEVTTEFLKKNKLIELTPKKDS